MDNYSKILNILNKVRRRVLFKKTLRNIVFGVCAALAAGILMALLSRIIPIYKVYMLWGYVAASIILIAVLSVFAMIPRQKAIAQLVDSFGLQERTITTLELKNEDSVYKELLLNDTVSKLEKLDYKRKIRLAPNKKIVAALIILALIFGATLILPDSLKDEAQAAHDFSEYKKEQKQKVEKSEKEAKENAALTEQQKKELLAKLSELKKELKKAGDIKEAEKALEKTAVKLEQLKKEPKTDDLKALAQKLEENKFTKDLADALKSAKAEAIKKQLEELKNKAKSMDAATKNSLKDTLAKAAGSLNDGDLKDSLDGLSNAVNSGDENAIAKSVDSVNSAISNNLSQKDMNEALAQAQQNLQQGQPQNAQGQGQGQGQGAGKGQGQGQGAGQGQGQGAGSGQGQGAGGSGAGSGSSSGDGGVTPYGQGGIANKQPSAGTEREYEKIFTPSRLGGQGETSVITGKSNGNSGKSETTISNNANATLGELKPYNQVVGEYSERAMESVNNSSIPGGMKDIIKSYFSSLQE